MTPVPQVLLIEDNPLDAELALLILGSEPGVQATVMHDPSEALSYLRREGQHAARATPDPDLILLDMNMPRMNGLEVLAALKEDPRTRHLRVVVYSTSDAQRDVEGSRALGASDYLVKSAQYSVMERTLLDTVRTWTHS